MTVAIHVSAESDSLSGAIANLLAIVGHLKLMESMVEKLPKNGVSQPVILCGIQIGSVSIEEDAFMNGRMRLRRVGPAVPAFERERQQYDFEKNAEKTD